MKFKQKLICLVLALASISSYAAKQDIFQGSWYSEGVVYSFVNDSLYVIKTIICIEIYLKIIIVNFASFASISTCKF